MSRAWRAVPPGLPKRLKNDAGTYAQRAAAGIAGNGKTTRKIELSTGHITPAIHPHQRTTTILTHLSCAVDLAVVYADGSTAGYSLSADASMKRSTFSGNGYTGHRGLSARGKGDYEYRNFNNVGPNIRRLVALGYR